MIWLTSLTALWVYEELLRCRREMMRIDIRKLVGRTVGVCLPMKIAAKLTAVNSRCDRPRMFQ